MSGKQRKGHLGDEDDEWSGQKRMAKRQKKQNKHFDDDDDDAGTMRTYTEDVHVNLSHGVCTIAVKYYGLYLVPNPEEQELGIVPQTKVITFDAVLAFVRESSDEPLLTLKDLVARFRDPVIRNISATTVGMWGPKDESGVAFSRQGEIKVAAFNALRTSIVTLLAEDYDGEIKSRRFLDACDLCTQENAYEKITRHSGYRRVDLLRDMIRKVWDQDRQLESDADVEAYKDRAKEAIGFYPEYEQLLDKAIQGKKIVPHVMALMRNKKPITELRGIGDIKMIREIMRMTRHNQAFLEYVSGQTFAKLSQEATLTLPPTLSGLLFSSVYARLQKMPEFGREIEETCGCNAASPEQHGEQGALIAPIKDAIIREIAIRMIQRKAMNADTWTGIKQILMDSTNARTLREDLDRISCTTTSKDIQWEALIEQTYSHMNTILADTMKSYLATGKIIIQVAGQDRPQSTQYMDKGGLASYLLEFMMFSSEDFQKRIESHKPASVDKKLATTIKCLHITTDRVDQSRRLSLAERLYAMFERIPVIVEHLMSKYMFYFKLLDLDCQHEVQDVQASLFDTLRKDRIFAGIENSIAFDVLFVVCNIVGTAKAATYTEFKNTLDAHGFSSHYKNSCILEEPGAPYFQISSKAFATHFDLTKADETDRVKVAIWSTTPIVFASKPSQPSPALENPVRAVDAECVIVEPAPNGSPDKSVVDAGGAGKPREKDNESDEDEDDDLPVVHLQKFELFVQEMEKYMVKTKFLPDVIENVKSFAKKKFKEYSSTIVFEDGEKFERKKEFTKACEHGHSLLKAMSPQLSDESKDLIKKGKLGTDRTAADKKMEVITHVLVYEEKVSQTGNTQTEADQEHGDAQEEGVDKIDDGENDTEVDPGNMEPPRVEPSDAPNVTADGAGAGDKPSEAPVTGEAGTQSIEPPVTGEAGTQSIEPPVTGEAGTQSIEPPVTGEAGTQSIEPPVTGEAGTQSIEPPVTGEAGTQSIEATQEKEKEAQSSEGQLPSEAEFPANLLDAANQIESTANEDGVSGQEFTTQDVSELLEAVGKLTHTTTVGGTHETPRTPPTPVDEPEVGPTDTTGPSSIVPDSTEGEEAMEAMETDA